ncbi:MAG TPA: hypothetical protein VNN17_08010 [Terriglobia bacterium]|nr:hypothetical protein [Terriglobia bacterium]
MRTSRVLAAVVLSLGVAAGAQEETKLPEWMEAASQNVGRLALSLQDKNKAEAAAAARDLQEIFRAVGHFFEENNSAGAAKYAAQARAGFRKVEELIAAEQLEEAYKIMQATRGNCEFCHREHRERAPDGTYRIKY